MRRIFVDMRSRGGLTPLTERQRVGGSAEFEWQGRTDAHVPEFLLGSSTARRADARVVDGAFVGTVKSEKESLLSL